MIARFCAYSALRNLRFFEPFIVLFLLLDVGLSYTAIGALLAYEKVLMGALEIPLGVVNDRFGRRRGLVLAFVLAAVAFAVFAGATRAEAQLAWLYVAQTLLAVAEALRTGTHKAMMLDWLTQQGMRDQKTRVMGLARFFSKSSAGVSALAAGVLVWATDAFTALFLVAVVPALLTAALVWTYPTSLEGGLTQKQPPPGPAPAPRRTLIPLVLVSVAFESQIKLALVYLQPYLAQTLDTVDLAVAGGIGAVAYGAWYFAQGLLAGFASLLSTRLVRWAGGEVAAVRGVHWLSLAAMGAVLVGLALDVPLLGLLSFLVFAALQNARRPIFVAALDDRMDPRYRATTLSVESQARSWAFAGSAVLAGILADAGGLLLAFVGMGVVLALSVWPVR